MYTRPRAVHRGDFSFERVNRAALLLLRAGQASVDAHLSGSSRLVVLQTEQFAWARVGVARPNATSISATELAPVRDARRFCIYRP